jgi:two-component system sensor histidine kinase AtoS
MNGIRDVRALIHLSPMREVDVLLSLQKFLEYRLIGVRKSGAVDGVPDVLEKTGERPLFPIPHEAIEQIIAGLPLGVLITGESGEIRYANEGFMKISGLKREQLDGMHYSRILRDLKQEQITDTYERELTWSGIDGRSALRRFWLYSIYPFTGTDAAERGMTILVRDVTELHRKELNDRRKDRLTSLGEFVAGMTHQLKNPVMLLETAVKWMLQESANREEVLDVSRRMQKNVERIRNLIADTLNYVSMDESSYSWLNLNDLILNTMPGLQEHALASGSTVEFQPMQTPPLIKGNETQIQEVVISLAVNALQAVEGLPGGGRLQLTTDLQEELEGAVQRKYLLMVVSDTGPGMSPQVVEKLFTPFFTTRPGGKGLGLAFAKRIVEEQGGFIRCWSKEGIGTHFYVYFRI